jgi:hypothetical protein
MHRAVFGHFFQGTGEYSGEQQTSPDDLISLPFCLVLSRCTATAGTPNADVLNLHYAFPGPGYLERVCTQEKKSFFFFSRMI